MTNPKTISKKDKKSTFFNIDYSEIIIQFCAESYSRDVIVQHLKKKIKSTHIVVVAANHFTVGYLIAEAVPWFIGIIRPIRGRWIGVL